MQAIENQATAAPSSLDEVPADAVAVVAAYAGFFDRAKLAVCGKLMSQACAKVTSELLIVQNFVAGDSNTREVYVGDDSHWRRCADPPNNFWSVDQTVCIDGRACVVSDENGARGARLAAQVSIYDPKRDEWCSEGGVEELKDSKWYGCCAFEGNLVFVFETAGDEDYAYQASPDEWEDMDTPAIYVLTGGNTWIPTGGRLGCTASRELYKSRGELFPDVYHVAAPPAWLQEMPVCLTQPWYSTWTDGAYEGTDYGRYASRMSHIESGRFCVVKA